MTTVPRTPPRPDRAQRRPSQPHELMGLLRELDVRPPGPARFKLVSRWAAKHVWRVDVDGEPWAYIRSLLGPGAQRPDRWRHLRLATLLHEARVGPRVLGITEESEALGGRAASVEAALKPIPRAELEARADEAIALLARLHSDEPLHRALAVGMTESERERLQPLPRLFRETRERWFEAVVERWLQAGLGEINQLSEVVSDLINAIEALECCNQDVNHIVPAHNDPNHGNFMVNRQGALRLIDFEDLALNTSVADLGVFLTWYADRDRQRELLAHYALADPETILERMQVWVPLRYLGISAHWAARLTRARDSEGWAFAADSVDEWLRGAAEVVAGGPVPAHLDETLRAVHTSLRGRGPLLAPAE